MPGLHHIQVLTLSKMLDCRFHSGLGLQLKLYIWVITYYCSSIALNSLYTEFHFLQVLLRLLIPCMSRIFTSAMS